MKDPEPGTSDAEVQAETESRIGDALREAAVNGSTELRRKTTRDAFATRLFLVVGVGAMVIAVVLLFAGVGALKDNQHTMASIQRQTRACVTPGTACYTQRVAQDKAQTTAIVAAVIGGVNEVSIYSAWCADKPGPQTIAQIQRCVTDKIHPK
jgi:hypothetical protein